MITDILLPQLSENLTSGTVAAIRVKAGDKVAKGQTILELETEKAIVDIPSPVSGIIQEICTKEGSVVDVGQLVSRVSSEERQTPLTQPTPAISSKPQAAPPPQEASVHPVPASGHFMSASPAVRKLAREAGIDISKVASGPEGHITVEDIKRFTRKNTAAPALSESLSPWGETSVEPMSTTRQKISENMSYAWKNIPHVTHFAKADITELEKLRVQYSTPARKMSVLPFVIRIVAMALHKFPKLNASLNAAENAIIFKKYVNIGIAVDTPHGLLVPVLKNADGLTTTEIADEVKALSEKARTRKIKLEEMQGGTFTVTNLGGITGGTFTPIINSPEAAILGLTRAQLEPYCIDGKSCAPRLMLPLSLSYDHRVVDGADAARFMEWVIDAIEHPYLIEQNSAA